MTDVPFHLTVMGKRYYEATLPSLVEAIERLNANLERMAARLDAAPQAGSQTGAAVPPKSD